MLNVAIAVDSAVDYGPEAVRVVASACQEVIGDHRCPVASDLEPGTVTAWYALVHPNDRQLSSVRIDFRDRSVDGVLIEQRTLAFSAPDSPQSRLASVGSVIAALAAAREGPLTPPAQKGAAPPASSVRAAAPEAAAHTAWALDLAALVAPAIDDGPSRVGALGRASLALSEHAFALAEGRYAAFDGNPHFSWWTLSLGLGSHTGDRSSRFSVELTGALVGELTTISATRGTLTDSADRWGWGGRGGVSGVWALAPRYAVVLGADATLVVPRINVVVGDDTTQRVPLMTFGLHVGLRFRP